MGYSPLRCAELRNINLHDTLDDPGWQSESSKGEEHLSTGINSDAHLEITLKITISPSGTLFCLEAFVLLKRLPRRDGKK